MAGINEFLIKHSGASGQLFFKDTDTKFFVNKKDPDNVVFFKPFESPLNVGKSFADIGTAPIFLTILAVEMLAFSVIGAVCALIEIVQGNKDNAKEAISDSAGILLASFFLAVTAVLSPIINTVDFIGSARTTVASACAKDEEVSEGIELTTFSR